MSEEMKAFLKGGLPVLIGGIVLFALVIVFVGPLAERFIAVTH